MMLCFWGQYWIGGMIGLPYCYLPYTTITTAPLPPTSHTLNQPPRGATPPPNKKKKSSLHYLVNMGVHILVYGLNH